MNAILPPTAPPTMAPKWEVVEGTGVLVGDGVLVVIEVLVGARAEVVLSEKLGVAESGDGVGVMEANAPWPISVGVGFI